MRTRRETILATIDDLVSDFLYYNRKEDEELGRGEIQKAIKSGEITLDEIATAFKDHLTAGIKSS